MNQSASPRTSALAPSLNPALSAWQSALVAPVPPLLCGPLHSLLFPPGQGPERAAYAAGGTQGVACSVKGVDMSEPRRGDPRSGADSTKWAKLLGKFLSFALRADEKQLFKSKTQN